MGRSGEALMNHDRKRLSADGHAVYFLFLHCLILPEHLLHVGANGQHFLHFFVYFSIFRIQLFSR